MKKTTQTYFFLAILSTLMAFFLCQKVEAEGEKVGPNTYVYKCPSPPFCYDNLKGKSVRITFLEGQTPEEFIAMAPKFRLTSKVVIPPTVRHREHHFIADQ